MKHKKITYLQKGPIFNHERANLLNRKTRIYGSSRNSKFTQSLKKNLWFIIKEQNLLNRERRTYGPSRQIFFSITKEEPTVHP